MHDEAAQVAAPSVEHGETEVKKEVIKTPEDVAVWFYKFIDVFVKEHFAHFHDPDKDDLQVNQEQFKALKYLYEVYCLAREFYKGAQSNDTQLPEKVHHLITANTYLPGQMEGFSSGEENPPASTGRTLFIRSYFHDLGNSLSAIVGYMEMMEVSEDPEWNQHALKRIQKALTNLILVHISFNLVEGKAVATREKLSQLTNYLSQLKGDHGKMEDGLDVSIDLNFDTRLEAIGQYDSFLNIPALLRLYDNAVQNSKKMYTMMKEAGSEVDKPLLKIKAKIVGDTAQKFLVLTIDDDGLGFPNARGLGAILPKALFTAATQISPSGVVYRPFIPEDGHTAWGGTVKGTGTGLAAMNEVFKSAGIDFTMGTRFSQGQYKGAHSELKVPLLKREVAHE